MLNINEFERAEISGINANDLSAKLEILEGSAEGGSVSL